MKIYAKDKKLAASLDDEATRIRLYGLPMAKKLGLRLDALRAAESLADFWPPYSGPERCHELKGKEKGVFSIDVKQPYRLLFQPVEVELPEDRSDEQGQWKLVKVVELLGIEDTHG